MGRTVGVGKFAGVFINLFLKFPFRIFGLGNFFLENDLSNLQWDAVNRFDYAFPQLSEWEWEKQIAASGVVGFLEDRFFLRR